MIFNFVSFWRQKSRGIPNPKGDFTISKCINGQTDRAIRQKVLRSLIYWFKIKKTGSFLKYLMQLNYVYRGGAGKIEQHRLYDLLLKLKCFAQIWCNGRVEVKRISVIPAKDKLVNRNRIYACQNWTT